MRGRSCGGTSPASEKKKPKDPRRSALAPCNQAFHAKPPLFATQEICQNTCLREKTGLIADQRLTWVGNPSVNDPGSPPVVDFVRSGEFRPPQQDSIFLKCENFSEKTRLIFL
jgi:hypothetical protein